MNTLKVDKKSILNHLEYFILRILKNGQKYKYLKLLKNTFILFSKYCYINRLNVPTYNYLSNSILNKNSLTLNSHDYTFIIKRIYKKKKWRKYINVTKLSFNYSKEKELYKLLYYVLYKLKLRTIQLRLFYLTYIFNFKFFRKIKLYKKLKKYYFMQLKSQRKNILPVFKKKTYSGQALFCLKKINKIEYNWNVDFYFNYINDLKFKFIDKLSRVLIFYYYFYLTIKKLPPKKILTAKEKDKELIKSINYPDYKKTFNFNKIYLNKNYLMISNYKYLKRRFFIKILKSKYNVKSMTVFFTIVFTLYGMCVLAFVYFLYQLLLKYFLIIKRFVVALYKSVSWFIRVTYSLIVGPFINWFIAYSLSQIYDDEYYVKESIQLRKIFFHNFVVFYHTLTDGGQAWLDLWLFYIDNVVQHDFYTRLEIKKNTYLMYRNKITKVWKKISWIFLNKK